MKNWKKSSMTLAFSLAACLATAAVSHAATAEQTCLSKRVGAWSKYEACVAKVMASVYAGAPVDDALQGKLAKCRTKLASVWPKLQALEGSATCSGTPRFEDLGNGTIQDNLTGRQWLKQGDEGGAPWGQDNLYQWSAGSPYPANGDLYGYYLYHTSGSSIGGHEDWRIPSLAEMLSILPSGSLPCGSTPCVDPAFNSSCTSLCSSFTCSCTLTNSYWTSAEVPGSSNKSYVVNFANGEIVEGFKTLSRSGRPVRGTLN